MLHVTFRFLEHVQKKSEEFSQVSNDFGVSWMHRQRMEVCMWPCRHGSMAISQDGKQMVVATGTLGSCPEGRGVKLVNVWGKTWKNKDAVGKKTLSDSVMWSNMSWTILSCIKEKTLDIFQENHLNCMCLRDFTGLEEEPNTIASGWWYICKAGSFSKCLYPPIFQCARHHFVRLATTFFKWDATIL